MATPAAVMAQGKSRTASGGDTTLRSLSLPPGHLPFPLDQGLGWSQTQARAVSAEEEQGGR